MGKGWLLLLLASLMLLLVTVVVVMGQEGGRLEKLKPFFDGSDEEVEDADIVKEDEQEGENGNRGKSDGEGGGLR